MRNEIHEETFYEIPHNNQEFNPFLRPAGKNYFFPLEMFYDEAQSLENLTYPLAGFSKYNCGDHYERKPCKVLRYNIETGKFFIKWIEKKDDKENIKETSRHTVRFDFEDEEQFLQKMEDAKKYTINFEAGIRYLARLELETFKQFDKIKISQSQEKKIIKKIGKDINELIHEDIFDEIRKNYVRGVVEFSFKIEHFASEAKKLTKP